MKKIGSILLAIGITLSFVIPYPTFASAFPLQLGSYTPENVTLTWRDDPKTTQHFAWRTAVAYPKTVVEAVPTSDTKQFHSQKVIRVNGVSQNYKDREIETMIHRAQMTGLTPGTEYFYRVGDGTTNGWSKVGTFRTASETEEPFTFLFVTDTQAYNAKGFSIWTRLHQQALNMYPDSRFVIHSGDIVDDGATMTQWELFLKASNGISDKIPFMSVLGNHDVYGNGAIIYNTLLKYPLNGPDKQKSLVYSFEYGNAKFLMLNSELGLKKMVEQQEWIRREVENADGKWVIAVFHRPPYKSNPKTSVNSTATTFAPILEDLGVDLVLNGHDHAYMRSKPMKNGKVSPKNDGTVYLIGGSAGPKFYKAEKNQYMNALYDIDRQIYTSITIDGDQLIGNVHTIDGKLVDSFGLGQRDRSLVP